MPNGREKNSLDTAGCLYEFGFRVKLPFEIDTYVSVYIVPCQSNNETKQKRQHSDNSYKTVYC